MYQTPRQLTELDAQSAGEAIVYRASTPPGDGPWHYRLYAIGPDGPEAVGTEGEGFLLVRIGEDEAVHEVAGPRTLLHQQWGEQLLDRLWEALDNAELPVEATDLNLLAAAEQRIAAEILSGPEPAGESATSPVGAAAADSSATPADDQQRPLSDPAESTADFAPGDTVWYRDKDFSQDGEKAPIEAVFVRLSDESDDGLLVQDVDGDDEPYLVHRDMVVAHERSSGQQVADAIRFRPRGQEDLAPSGRVARIRANIAALRVLHTLRDEQRPATATEQAVLARWSSWGAVPEIFDPRKREFAGLRGELRSLLSEQEWYAAEATTRNAHFTDAALVEPIWQALKDLGFQEGRLLEPGCGSGNFLAFAPEAAQMTGVELDPVTAEIAAALYPNAEVRAESFVDTRYPEGYFDGAIGNVPFDEVALTDPIHNPLRLPTHNHFIVKALEMVRPGGLVAVLTSRFTLDSMGKTSRLEIADRADLVGAVRLPAGAHRKAAGTNAVSDLLILRRRDGQVPDSLPEWLGLAAVQVDSQTKISVNGYFAKHPERVLGTLSVTNTQYGRKDITVRPDPDTPLAEALTGVLATITRQARESGLTMSASPDALQRAEVEHRAERMRRAQEMFGEELSRFEGTLLDQKDGTFLQLVGGELSERPVFKNSVEELRSLLSLRDTYVELLSAESSGDDEHATALRQQLNARYDTHVRQYDFLNRRDTRRDRRSAQGCFRTDPYAAGVYALEIYDKEANTAKKSPIFSRAVSTPKSEQHTADTPQDALAISLNTYGEIRLGEIARLLGIESLDETRDVLGELVYNEPGSQRLVPAAEYLSGNVRKKIEQVENILQMVSDESRSQHPFQANRAALRRVLPPDKQPGDIEDIQFGATWVKPKFYEQFLRQLLQTRYVTVTRESGADWEIEAPSGVRKSRAATKVYGTAKRNAIDLAQRMLRRASLVVHPPKLDEDASARAVLDAKRWAAEQTEQTIAKSDEISRLFADWLWQDPDRSAECLADYNRLYNSYVPYQGDGAHLTFPGISDVITPRPHQRAGVARALAEPGGSFFDYEVGFGKTLTIAMTLMEMKRLRMVNKPCVVVKNATVNDFRNDFLKAYPGARVLAIDSSEFTKETAAAYVAQIANGDWDAVILPQSLFKRIPMSGRGQEQFVADQTAEYRARIHQVLTGSDEALSAELNPGADPLVSEALDTVAALGATSGAVVSRDTVKKLQGDLKRHTQRAEKNLVKQTTMGISWEQTGIDFIAVDEVQDFANGEVGANNSELALPVSAQAKDLKVKIRTMEKAYGPKVALGSTGTPFPNAMPQAFVMLDYFRRDLLQAAEIGAFSSFQAQYLMDRVSPEISPEGIPRMKERIGAFRNALSFHVLWTTMADVKTRYDITLPVPKYVSTTEVVDATQADREYMEDIAFRAEIVRAGDVDASVDNLLKISNDGRLAAMDLRMVGTTPDGPGKIDAAVEKIFRIYQEYKDRAYTDREGVPSALPGALQLVFADRGTPSDENRKAGKFIAYDYLKDQLVERGIPAGQIRFAQEAKNAEEKEALWAACRRGQVAVVIGSTETMGVGVNVQDRAIALHHLDCPWRPSDVTQREGRIVRQFNQHFDQNIPVQIFRWVKEGSFDSFMWQTVERKARFIDQVRTGRDLEEQDRALDGDLGKDYLEFGEIKAIATGNPLLLKKMQAEEEVRQLEAAHTNWKRTHQHLRNVVDTGDETLAKAQENTDLVARAAGASAETKGSAFRMELPNGKIVKKRQDAATALRTQLALMHRQMHAGASSWEHVATLGGQEFHARVNGFADYIAFSINGLRDVPQTTFTVSDVNAVLSDGKPPLGLITRMENQVEKLGGLHATLLAVVDELKQEIDRAQKLVDQPFTKTDKLRRARATLVQLEAEIDSQAGARTGQEAREDDSSGAGKQDNGAAEAEELARAFQDWRATQTFSYWRLEASRSGNSTAEDTQRRLVEAAGDAITEEIARQRHVAQEGGTPDFRALPHSQALLDAATAYLDVLGTVPEEELRSDAQEVTRELIYGVRDYLADAADRTTATPVRPAATEPTPHSAEPESAQARPEQERQPTAGKPATVGSGPNRRAAEPYADRADYWSAEQSALGTYRAWAEEFGSRLGDGTVQEQALARAAQQVLSASQQTRHSRLLGLQSFATWEEGQALADAARVIADQWDREQHGHAAVSRTWDMYAAVRDHFARYRVTTEDPQSTTFRQWAATAEPITIDDEEALESIPGLSMFNEYTVTGPDGMRTEPVTGAVLAGGIAQLIADNGVVEETDGGLTLTAPNGMRFDIAPSTAPAFAQDSGDGPGTSPGEEDPILARMIAHDIAAMAGGGWTEVVRPFGSQEEATDNRDQVEAAYERWAATQTALPMLVDAQDELVGEELGITNPAGYVASWHHRSRMAAGTAGPTGGRMVVEQFEGLAQAARRADSQLAEEGAYASEADRARLLHVAEVAARYAQRLSATLDFLAEQRAQNDPAEARMHEVRALESAMEYLTDQGAAFRMDRRRSTYTDREAAGTRMRDELLDGFRQLAELPPEKQNLDANARVLYGHIRGIPLYVGFRDLGTPQAQAVCGFDQLPLLEHDSFTLAELEALTPLELIDRIEGSLAPDALGAIRERELTAVQALLVADVEGTTAAGSTDTRAEQQPGAYLATSTEDQRAPAPAAQEVSGTPPHAPGEQETSPQPLRQETPGTTRLQAQNLAVLLGLYTDPGELVAGRELVHEAVEQLQEAAQQHEDTTQGAHAANLIHDVSEANDALQATPQVSPAEVFPLYDRLASAASTLADSIDGPLADKAHTLLQRTERHLGRMHATGQYLFDVLLDASALDADSWPVLARNDPLKERPAPYTDSSHLNFARQLIFETYDRWPQVYSSVGGESSDRLRGAMWEIRQTSDWAVGTALPDWMNVVSAALGAAEEASEGVSRSVLRDVAQRSYQHHQSLASFQLAAERAEPYGAERSYTNGADGVTVAWDAWMATRTAAYLLRRETTGASPEAPQAHQLRAQEELREALYAADWAQTDDGSLDEITRRTTKAAHTAYALVLSLGEGSYREREDATILNRLVRASYEHAAACRASAQHPDSVRAVRSQLTERQEQLRAASPAGTRAATGAETPAAHDSADAVLEIEHHYRGTVVRGVTSEVSDAPIRAALGRHDFKVSKDGTFWYLPRRMVLTNRAVHVRKLIDDLNRLGRPHQVTDEPADQDQPEITLPAGEPYTSKTEASQDFEEMFAALWRMRETPAGRRLITRGRDTRPDGAAVWLAMEELRQGPVGSNYDPFVHPAEDVVSRCTALAHAALTLARNLEEERYRAPVALPHLRTMTQYATVLASRVTATSAQEGLWQEVFGTETTTPGTDEGTNSPVSGNETTTAPEERAPEAVGATRTQVAADLTEPVHVTDPLVAGPYGDEELRAAVDHLQHLYQEAAQALPTWHRPDVPPGPSGDVEAWYRGPGKIELPEGFVPFADDRAVLKVGDVIREGSPRWLESKKLSYKTIVITGDEDPSDGYYRAAPGTRVHPREIVGVPADSRLVTGAEEDRYTIRGTFWDRWKVAEVAGGAGGRGELPLPATIDAYRQAFIATGALARILDGTSVPDEAGILLARLNEATERHIVRLTLTHRVAEENAESEQRQRDQARESQEADEDEQRASTDRAQKRAEIESMISESLARQHGRARERAVEAALADPYVRSAFEAASKEEMRPRFREWLRFASLPDSDGTASSFQDWFYASGPGAEDEAAAQVFEQVYAELSTSAGTTPADGVTAAPEAADPPAGASEETETEPAPETEPEPEPPGKAAEIAATARANGWQVTGGWTDGHYSSSTDYELILKAQTARGDRHFVLKWEMKRGRHSFNSQRSMAFHHSDKSAKKGFRPKLADVEREIRALAIETGASTGSSANAAQDASTQPQADQPAAVTVERDSLTAAVGNADLPAAAGIEAPTVSSTSMGTRLAEEHLQSLPHESDPRRDDDARLAVVTTLNFPDGQVHEVLLLLQMIEVDAETGDDPIVRGAQIVPPNNLIATVLNGQWLPGDLLAMADARVLPLSAPIPWDQVERLATLPAHRARLALPLGTPAADIDIAAPPALSGASAQSQDTAEQAETPQQGNALHQPFGSLGDRLMVGHIGASTAAPSSPAPVDPSARASETPAVDEHTPTGTPQEQTSEASQPVQPAKDPQQQEERVAVTETEPTPGPWSSRITIVGDATGTYVTGTTGAPQEDDLRELLKRNKNFKYEKGRWRYAGMRGQKEQVLEEVRAFLTARDAQESAVATVASGKYPPTAQQQEIITAAVEGKNVAVQALAGTGKTSTLVMIAAQMLERRIGYIAFNRAIADEAGQKFGRNVTARTSHSFALQDLRNTPYRQKVSTAGRNSGARRPKDVAAALGITAELRVGDPEGNVQHVRPEEIAKIVMGAVRRYRQSADAELGRQHLGEKWAHVPAARTLLDYSRRAWADIADPNSNKIVFDHDDYLKIWALGNPRLNFDTIFFDEAQDINPVLKKVIQDQDAQIIVVGDSNQAIYEFRGAIDALKDWPADVVLPLTQSWRFGPAVAEVGNAYLALLESDLRLQGAPTLDTVLGTVEEPDAILTYTNVGAISAVFTGFEAGKRVALVGGGRDIEDIARAARDLQQGRRTAHPELSAFENWSEVKEYAESDEDAQTLQTFVRLVDRYTPQGLLNMIRDLVPEEARAEETRPELVVSTAHKSKGREWDLVQIWNDFPQPKEDTKTGELLLPAQDKLRLAYVAVTRARQRLDIGSLGWIHSVGSLADAHPAEITAAPAAEQAAPASAAVAVEPAAVPEPPLHPAPIEGGGTDSAAEVSEDQPDRTVTEAAPEVTAASVPAPAAAAAAAEPAAPGSTDDTATTAEPDTSPTPQAESGAEGQPETITSIVPGPAEPLTGADQPVLFAGPEISTPAHERTTVPSAAPDAEPDIAPLPWDDQKIKKRGSAGIRRGQKNEIPNLAREMREVLGENQVRDVWEMDNPWAQFEENLRHTRSELGQPDSALSTLVTEAAGQLRTQIDQLAAEAFSTFETMVQAHADAPDRLADLDTQLSDAHRLPELTDPLVRRALTVCLEAVDAIERTARSRKAGAAAARDALEQVMGLAGTSYSPDGQQIWPNVDAALAPVKVQVDRARERIAELSNSTVTEQYARLRALIAAHQAQPAAQSQATEISAAAVDTSEPPASVDQEERVPEPLNDRDIGAVLSKISPWHFGKLIFELDQTKRATPQLHEGWLRLPSEPGYNEAGTEFASAYSTSGAFTIEVKTADDAATVIRAGRLTLAKAIAWLRPGMSPERRQLVAAAWRSGNAMTRSELGFEVIGESGRWKAADSELGRILRDAKGSVIREALESHLTGTADERVARFRAAENWEQGQTLPIDFGGMEDSFADLAALERVNALRAVLPDRRNGVGRLGGVEPGDCLTGASEERLPFIVRERPVVSEDAEVSIVGELVVGPGELRPYTWETGRYLDDLVEPLLLPQSLAGLVDLPADAPVPGSPAPAEPAAAPGVPPAAEPVPEAAPPAVAAVGSPTAEYPAVTAPDDNTARAAEPQPEVPAAAETAAPASSANAGARPLPYETQAALLNDLYATESRYDAWANSATGRLLLSEARELQEETGVTDSNEAARIQTAFRNVVHASGTAPSSADAVLRVCRDLHTTVAEAGRSLAARAAFVSEEDRLLLLAVYAQAQEQLARLEVTENVQTLLDSEHDGARLFSRFTATRLAQSPSVSETPGPASAQEPRAVEPQTTAAAPLPQTAPAAESAEQEPVPLESNVPHVEIVELPEVLEKSTPQPAPAAEADQVVAGPAPSEPAAGDDGFDFWTDVIGDDIVVNGVVYSSSEWEPDPEDGVRRRRDEDDEPVSAEELAGLELDEAYEALIREEHMAATEAVQGQPEVAQPDNPGEDDFDRHFEDIVALLRGAEPPAGTQAPIPRPRFSAGDEQHLREQYAATRQALSGILTSIDADPILPVAEDPAVEAGDAAALEAAMSNAQAEAGSYWGTPEWTMIRSIGQAGQQLRGSVREALLTYAETTLGDIRAHGINRTIEARTARAISHGAMLLARRLERSGQRDSRGWRAVWGLHRAAATRADRLTGLLPAGQRTDLAGQLSRAWQWFSERLAARSQDTGSSTGDTGNTTGSDEPGRIRAMLANGVESIGRLYGAVSERLGNLAQHPAWQRITSVWSAVRDAARRGWLGVSRFMADRQTMGTGRALWLRTLEIISSGAQALINRLASNGGRDGLRWNLLRVLRHAAEDHIAHLHGHLPEDVSTPLGTYESAVDEAAEQAPATAEGTAPHEPPSEAPSAEGAGSPPGDENPVENSDLFRAVVLQVAAREFTLAMDLSYGYGISAADADILLARMEDLGVVGPQEGNGGVREVLVTPGEAESLLDASAAADRPAPRWQPVNEPLTAAWFDEVRTAVRSDVQPDRGLTRRDLMSLLGHENARPGDRADAGRRANESVDLFLQGRGAEVPQRLAGEGFAYVRGEANRDWALREASSPAVSSSAASGPAEAEADQQAAAGTGLPRRLRPALTDGPSRIERAAAGPRRQTAPTAGQNPAVASDAFEVQAQRMRDRAEFARAAATSPAEERAAGVLETIAANSRATAERISGAAAPDGGPLAPGQPALTAEAFLAALRTTAQARGAQIPDDLLASAMEAAQEAVAAAASPAGAAAAGSRPTRRGQAEREQTEHRLPGQHSAPGGVGRR
ncbi:UvrD-helicase domain-containing protein [Streptomyces sp. NPDC013161]|uniref:UvrD-helicase domain-containing protein n=1 Tax=Streptomyces sp. NPDC013161 TaxID=3364862 RepID=UPI003691BFA9